MENEKGKTKKLYVIKVNTTFSNDIFDEVLEYDIRRMSLPKDLIGKKLYVYSATVNKGIAGYVRVDEIIRDTPEKILAKSGYDITTKLGSSLYKYLLGNKGFCSAMHLYDVTAFDELLPHQEMYKINKEKRFDKYVNVIYEDDPLYRVITEWDKTFSLNGENEILRNKEVTQAKNKILIRK